VEWNTNTSIKQFQGKTISNEMCLDLENIVWLLSWLWCLTYISVILWRAGFFAEENGGPRGDQRMSKSP
jgi:hypothetical protein